MLKIGRDGQAAPNAELLDEIAAQLGCRYLSDLKHLSGGRRKLLAQDLKAVRADAAALREWNDALCYLTETPPAQTQEAAKALLIERLQQDIAPDGTDDEAAL